VDHLEFFLGLDKLVFFDLLELLLVHMSLPVLVIQLQIDGGVLEFLPTSISTQLAIRICE
jgi:hypothetical protein